MILDKAASALDAGSEHLVREAIERLMQSRTTLVIAHRLSTVKGAHRVVVLDAEQIAQIGTHASLLSEDVIYRRLVEKQFAAQRGPQDRARGPTPHRLRQSLLLVHPPGVLRLPGCDVADREVCNVANARVDPKHSLKLNQLHLRHAEVAARMKLPDYRAIFRV